MTQNDLPENQTQSFQEALNNFATVLIETMTPVMTAAKSFYDIYWTAYLAADAPYGENPDGMLRWLKEVNEAKHLQLEAERILDHHKMLANFRKNLPPAKKIKG